MAMMNGNSGLVFDLKQTFQPQFYVGHSFAQMKVKWEALKR